MRVAAGAALVFALCACGDDGEGDQPTGDAGVALDGGSTLDAMLVQKCGPVTACQSGAITTLPELCISAPAAQQVSDSWQVCVIDPQGHTAYIAIPADSLISSPGWTYANYAFVDSTLTDEGYDACLEERSKLIVPTVEDQPDAGNVICYRRSASNGDD